MIVAKSPSGLSVVMQVDHQEQCAAAARAWGNATFPRLNPWEPVVRAAGIHDEGWRDWEAAPEIDGAGRPVDFPQLDRERHMDLYRNGIAAAFAAGPLVGLLVSMHGEGLYRSRPGLVGPGGSSDDLSDAGRAFAEDQRALQERTLAQLGADTWSRWARDAHRLIQTWDALSLYLTWRGLRDGSEGRLRAVPTGRGGEFVELVLTPQDDLTATCDPFPFAGEQAVLPVMARIVPDRAFASDDDLRAALAVAPVEERSYRVVAAEANGR